MPTELIAVVSITQKLKYGRDIVVDTIGNFIYHFLLISFLNAWTQFKLHIRKQKLPNTSGISIFPITLRKKGEKKLKK
tara:strand:- start:26 stop:259 length:234 start_codon:yes stop_codon:yes gene_type:complete